MSGVPTPTETSTPHVLFAILDWGMGHATRTWPLIVAARSSGARITVASRGTAGAWLDARMAEWDQANENASTPPWKRVEKPGVTIRYGKGRSTLLRIGLQIPRFMASFRKERQWTHRFILQNDVTHVLSDNCYGCHARSTGARSVFMTHQFQPPVPGLAKPLAKAQVQRLSQAFDEAWIPDSPECSFAGNLSISTHPNTRYVGPLSRFQVLAPRGNHAEATGGPFLLLGLVSGPEPQRSHMESALRACFLKDGRPALIFSGRPGQGKEREANVLTVHDPEDAFFRHAILEAQCIICRSGYSTLMDLAVLGKTAILVPTVGQPEQEGLAKRWSNEWGWKTLQTQEIPHFRPSAPTGRFPSAEAPCPERLMGDWLGRTP